VDSIVPERMLRPNESVDLAYILQNVSEAAYIP
jgi:hypothetical protein